MSAHVPAWKRLGLKLKGPASGEASLTPGGPNAVATPSSHVASAQQSRGSTSLASALKRKLPIAALASSAASAHTPNKKARREDRAAADQGTPSGQKKSVSFAAGTKDKGERKKEKKAKKAKKKANKKTDAARPETSLEPSLDYLRQWHTARDSWKFNKNHQTLLIKYLFDGDRVPSSDVPIFYQYIRDLKGFVRTRLRETAAEIRKADMEAGAGGFPAPLKDKETKQKEYEETISRFLQDLEQHGDQPDGKRTSKNANGKRALDEVEYVLRVATPEVKRRLLKRVRAEMVLRELSDSEESGDTAATATTTTTEVSSSSAASSTREPVAAATADRASRRSDGSQQPAKRRRLRNVRTAVDDDDSSSSESESSESESDESGSGSGGGGSSSSSSSSSESDESEDEEMDLGGRPAESSSSSSSSSSEAESDSDEGGETESGSASSSSSED